MRSIVVRTRSGFTKLFLLTVLAVWSVACGAKRAIDPLKPSGFIEWRTTGTLTERTPFSYYWADAESPVLKQIRGGARYELYVAPVKLDYLFSHTDSPDTLAERAKEVADRLHEKLLAAIREQNEGAQLVTLVGQPMEQSLTLEIALTQLETGNPVGYAAGFASPVPGTATVVDALGTASLAFEARLTESRSGQVLAEFADRKIPRVRPVDLNKFTKTRPLFDIADDWATEIARTTVTNVEKDKLEGTASFSLLPW